MMPDSVKQLAAWHACVSFFPDEETMPPNFSLDEVLTNLKKDGTLTDGSGISGEFDGKPEKLAEMLEARTDAFISFFQNVLSNSTYFADDGNYGEASGLLFINTKAWSKQNWDDIQQTSDVSRQGVALQIALSEN